MEDEIVCTAADTFTAGGIQEHFRRKNFQSIGEIEAELTSLGFTQYLKCANDASGWKKPVRGPVVVLDEDDGQPITLGGMQHQLHVSVAGHDRTVTSHLAWISKENHREWNLAWKNEAAQNLRMTAEDEADFSTPVCAVMMGGPQPPMTQLRAAEWKMLEHERVVNFQTGDVIPGVHEATAALAKAAPEQFPHVVEILAGLGFERRLPLNDAWVRFSKTVVMPKWKLCDPATLRPAEVRDVPVEFNLRVHVHRVNWVAAESPRVLADGCWHLGRYLDEAGGEFEIELKEIG